MIANKLLDFVVNENSNLSDAYWKFTKWGGVTIVCDNDEKFVGIIGTTDWKWAINYGNIETTKIKDIVNRECISISDCDPYVQARNIYAEKNIEYLPVINEKRDVIDLFTRKRAFYKYFL